MDTPTVQVRQGIDAAGVPCITVEVAVDIRQSGMVLLAIDLSDSSQVSKADVSRLPRYLTPLPRTWGVKVTGLGTAAAMAASRWQGATIGDVVDGVVNLAEALFDPAVIARERNAGSFLSPVLSSFVSSIESEEQRLLAMIVTDGRLSDVDPIALPKGMQVLGMAPEHGPTDVTRWNEIVPGAPMVGRDMDRDAIGTLRTAAGCGFHGPCTVIIPDGECRMRAASDVTAGASPLTAERRRHWDFSLRGRLLLEFVGSTFPDHILVEGADKSRIRLPLLRPTEAFAASVVSDGFSERGDVPDAITLDLIAADSIALVQTAQELSKARAAWQGADGLLTIVPPCSPLATQLLDHLGRHRADGFLLIAAELGDDFVEASSEQLILVPLRRASRFAFSSTMASPPLARFSAGASWSLHFDNLENRWMLTFANKPPVPLPPRGSHGLPVDVRDDRGRPCHVFFSGPFRAP